MGYKLKLPVDTNFIFLDLEDLGVSNLTFQEYCAAHGVRVLVSNRIAVHHQISQLGVDKLLKALSALMNDVKAGSVTRAKKNIV